MKVIQYSHLSQKTNTNAYNHTVYATFHLYVNRLYFYSLFKDLFILLPLYNNHLKPYHISLYGRTAHKLLCFFDITADKASVSCYAS